MKAKAYIQIGIALCILVWLSILTSCSKSGKVPTIQTTYTRARVLKTNKIIPVIIPKDVQTIYHTGDTLQSVQIVNEKDYYITATDNPEDKTDVFKNEYRRVILQ